MSKGDVRTFRDLAAYARERWARSVRRNDPVAACYWKETEHFAEATGDGDMSRWASRARMCAGMAEDLHRAGQWMLAAIWYSRAKWFVILGRNNGLKMSPAATGVNLRWLREGVPA